MGKEWEIDLNEKGRRDERDKRMEEKEKGRGEVKGRKGKEEEEKRRV